MAFPESFVEDVRRVADIVKVISEHVALKKTGASWKGLCPFHQEKSPSFNVRQEPAVFHCFGCGEGGDVFKFLMLRERTSFPETVETLARRFGVPVPEGRVEAGPDRKEREELLALMEAAAQHFTRTFWTAQGTKAREYLLGRGFTKETLEKIRAGAARDAWDDLLGALRGKFAPALLLKAGLVLERQGKEGHYDRFRNRAVFPILNESGKVVAFGARSLDGSEPKYLNSPETPFYSKSRILYGLNWARDPIVQGKRAVLMEGYLDVARALEQGVSEVVATCGTALTGAHARLLKRFAETAVLNFDQDEAGQKAARKSLEVLLEEGVRVRIVELPEGHDPDTFLKAEGADGLPEAARRGAGSGRVADAPRARAPRGHDAGGQGGVLRRTCCPRSCAPRTRSSARPGSLAWPSAADSTSLRRARSCAGRSRAGRARPRPSSRPPRSASRRPSQLRTLLPAERWLLALVAQSAAGVEDALKELEDHHLEGLRAAELLRAARALAQRDERVTLPLLLAELDEDARRLMSEIAVTGAPLEHLSAEECVRVLRRQPLEARMAEIQKSLAGASGEAQDALLAEKMRLRRQMAEF